MSYPIAASVFAAAIWGVIVIRTGVAPLLLAARGLILLHCALVVAWDLALLYGPRWARETMDKYNGLRVQEGV